MLYWTLIVLATLVPFIMAMLVIMLLWRLAMYYTDWPDWSVALTIVLAPIITYGLLLFVFVVTINALLC